MVIRVVQPNSLRSIVDEDGSPSIQLNTWFKIITDKSLIIGTGAPDGVIEAGQGASYMDETGATGSISYIKRDADILGDKTLGWVLV